MKERIISAIVMILITLPLLLIGGVAFNIFVLIISELALYEFLKFRKKIPMLIKVLAYLILAIITFKDILNINIESLIIIEIFVFLSSLIFINHEYHYKDAFYLIGLILFLGISFSKVIFLRNLGINHLIYLLLIATLTDTFAFLIGTRFGKKKLAPTISPNKTLEGLIGGIVVGTLFGTIYYIFYIKSIKNIILIFLLTISLSLIGELGDLIKSSIKRYEKVKDFSNLIPGHGGIMDRIDSLIFIVLMYILIINFGGLL